ncbi:MAG: hypothetical protein Q8K92_24390 [Leadbetterella sp.]|nr:hypothetical protein [Leadbetterella sp.]
MKFATILSTAFLLISLKNGICQKENNYIEYYHLCNSGDSLFHYKNYKEAILKYEAAFKTVNFVHAKILRNASICASKKNQKKVAWDYAKRAISGGENEKFLKNSFPKNISKELLKDSINLLKNQHLKSVNHLYIKEIDSLYFVDQNIIRGNKTVKSDGDFSKLAIPQNKFDLDRDVWNHLIGLMSIYGFPSEKNIGPKAYEQVSIILHHNFRLPQNQHQMPIATEALKKGEYLPQDFAWMFDQFLSMLNKNPFFYYGSKDPSRLSKDELLQIEENRRKYGVKPFSAYKIKVWKDSISQTPIW